ncbi:MAG: LysR family transcriptional regulator [Nannocystaceae bacterium]|nr:LysR family transcriptional regulator [Nannocystaceae bacterium]
MSRVHDDVGALRGVDLNLLVAFDAVARAGNVTAAARVVGVTQSAMSHALRRLRALFDDPLFVRSPGGVSLTPRAQDLLAPVRNGLITLARALHERAVFDPGTTSRTFVVSSVELVTWVGVPAMLRVLAQDAPRAGLTVRPLDGDFAHGLETGDIDLGIVPLLEDPEPFDRGFQLPGSLRQRVARRDGYRCYIREDHPALAKGKRLGRRAYVGLGHVLVSPRGSGSGVVDRVLAQAQLERHIRLRVPSFPAALHAVACSDVVLTGPTALDGLVPGVRSLQVPIALPKHAITLVWHPRMDADPGHQWFRGLAGKALAV